VGGTIGRLRICKYVTKTRDDARALRIIANWKPSSL
jgi:hypothetical protein